MSFHLCVSWCVRFLTYLTATINVSHAWCMLSLWDALTSCRILVWVPHMISFGTWIQSDVDCCIVERAFVLWKGWGGWAAPLQGGCSHWIRLRVDGHAFPDCRGHWARVEPSTMSQALVVGWLVPGCGVQFPGAALTINIHKVNMNYSDKVFSNIIKEILKCLKHIFLSGTKL